MPRSKDPAAYPQQFFQLLEVLRTGREELSLEMPTEKAAYSLRREFYAFRSALSHQVRSKSASEIDHTNYRTIIAYKAIAMGPTLLIIRADATPMMKNLDAALSGLAANIPQSLAEGDLEKHLEELGYGTSSGKIG